MDAPKPPDPLFVLRSPRVEVNSLCFQSKDRILYSGGLDGSITAWNLTTRRSLASFNAHSSTPLCDHPAVQGLFISESGLISQGREGILKLWDFERFSASSSPISTVVTNCSNFVTAASIVLHSDRNVQNIQTSDNITGKKEEPDSPTPLTPPVSFLSQEIRNAGPMPLERVVKNTVLPGRKPLVAIPADGSAQIDIIDMISRETVVSLHTQTKERIGMAMSVRFISAEDSTEVFVSVTYEDGSLYIWSLLQPGQPIVFRKQLFNDPALCCTFNKKGTKVLIGGASDVLKSVHFKSANSWDIVKQKSIQLPRPGIGSIEVRHDEKIFATAGWDHRVRLFSMKSNKALCILKHHTKTVHCVSFDPSSNMIASGASDNHVALWAMY